MPTPTCASCIMGTSLAPSPTANVTGRGFTLFRTSCTISAFCRGETRQAITTEQRWAIPRNLSSSADPFRTSSACPVTMSPATQSPSAALLATASIFSRLRSISAVPRPSTSRSKISMSLLRTLVLKPISLAVSSLSPVKTHNLMPARRRDTIVSATPTWSLSSIAVTPRISSFVSMFSATAARASSRFCSCTCARSYSSCHFLNSASASFRRPITRVRSPLQAKALRWAWILGSALSARSSITLSAPFTKMKCSPESLRTMTDIRFLEEVNALSASAV
mmetsp:Transcript_108995/g.308324  ORF Transcript_108995/g.308324 Transcript_108995/m.308324 type:complete len:279 (+) Transcript_108995:723-1559(+)